MQRFVWLTALSLGALLPLGCAEREPPRTAAVGFHSGQKWEYRVVKIDKDEERDLTTVLNIQAKDGWEYHSQITTDGHYLVFQRSTGQVGNARTTAKYPPTATRKVPAPPSTKPPPPPKEKSPEPDVKKIPEPDVKKIPIPEPDPVKIPDVKPPKK